MHKIETIAKEYLHLKKTQSGIAESLREKRIELSTECRKIVASGNFLLPTTLLAKITLAEINGK